MLYEVKGDILLSKAQVIAHGVSPMDPMDRDLPLSLHKLYPQMHKEFHHWCHQEHPKTGTAWLWDEMSSIKIVNLLIKEGGYNGNHPEKATLANVNHSLRVLKKIVLKEKFTSIALPRLATGLGGLEWSDVKNVIHNQLNELDIPIYIYVAYIPNIQAEKNL